VSPEIQALAEKTLGYTFKNRDLLKEALTHSSVADNRLDSNERMEFLGDAVLDLVVCHELYKRFPEYMEGDLTKIKSAVVSRRTCAEVSNETGLTDLLITGKGIHDRSQMPSSLAAAVYESITASIYLDGGFEAVKEYVLRTMTPKIDDIASNSHHQNYKAVLQQHAQKILGGTPVYELLDEKGPDHSKCFEVCVVVDGHRYNSAWGPNKKMAEQKAALFALEQLGVFDAPEVDKLLESIQDMEGGNRQIVERPAVAAAPEEEIEETVKEVKTVRVKVKMKKKLKVKTKVKKKVKSRG
jgi:ribonuclease-3